MYTEEQYFNKKYLAYDTSHPHRHFGGRIYESDFSADYPHYPGQVADEILSSLNFDYRCIRNSELKAAYKEGGASH